MILDPNEFSDIEEFTIEISEWLDGEEPSSSLSITEIERVGKIFPKYFYSDLNRELHAYDLSFQFKGMYLDRENFHKVDRSYNDSIVRPPKHRHVKRIITFKITYRDRKIESNQ